MPRSELFMDNLLRFGSTEKWRFGEIWKPQDGLGEVKDLIRTIERRICDYALDSNNECKYLRVGNTERIPKIHPQYYRILEAQNIHTTTRIKRPITEVWCQGSGEDIVLNQEQRTQLHNQLQISVQVLPKAAHIQTTLEVVGVKFNPSISLKGVIRTIDYVAAAGLFGFGTQKSIPILVSRSNWDTQKIIRNGKTSKQIIDDYIAFEDESKMFAYWAAVQAMTKAFSGGLPGLGQDK